MSSKCMAIVSPDPNRLRDLSLEIGLWISSRGAMTILVDLAEDAALPIGRISSDVKRHTGSLRGTALRGYLSYHDRPNLGAMSCPDGIAADVLADLSEAYSLILFISGERALARLSDVVPGIPALIIAEAKDRNGISSAAGLIDRMLEGKGLPQPSGFVPVGAEAVVAARIARQWRVPMWGLAGDIENIAGRVLDRAVPLPQGADAHKAADAKTDEGKPVIKAPSVRHFDAKCSDLSARILEALRKDSQFRDMRVAPGDREQSALIRTRLAAAARRMISEMDTGLLEGMRIEDVVKRVLDDSVGFGPIEGLLADARVTEIMINGEDAIYAERDGMIEACPDRFSGREQLMAVIERMVAGAGRRIDEASPMVDARLGDGSRLNVIIPPLAIDGPCVTIRRFTKRIQGMDDAVAAGMLTREAAGFLSSCVRAKASILISGGTGAGKTTLLGILAGAIGPGERTITIEDAAELSLSAAHVVRLESRRAGLDGTGAVTIRDLVRNALRMRPDRIVVGECRGPEALDMLQAMNTGHEGSLTTVHANSPRDALARIETMVLMAGMDLPLGSVREQIVRAVDLIVQVARGGGGARRVVEISELTGMEGSVPCMRTLAAYSAERDILEGSGLTPRLAERFKGRGVCISPLDGDRR